MNKKTGNKLRFEVVEDGAKKDIKVSGVDERIFAIAYDINANILTLAEWRHVEPENKEAVIKSIEEQIKELTAILKMFFERGGSDREKTVDKISGKKQITLLDLESNVIHKRLLDLVRVIYGGGMDHERERVRINILKLRIEIGLLRSKIEQYENYPTTQTKWNGKMYDLRKFKESLKEREEELVHFEDYMDTMLSYSTRALNHHIFHDEEGKEIE